MVDGPMCFSRDRNVLSCAHGLTRRFYHFARDCILVLVSLIHLLSHRFSSHVQTPTKRKFSTAVIMYILPSPNRSPSTSSSRLFAI